MWFFLPGKKSTSTRLGAQSFMGHHRLTGSPKHLGDVFFQAGCGSYSFLIQNQNFNTHLQIIAVGDQLLTWTFSFKSNLYTKSILSSVWIKRTEENAYELTMPDSQAPLLVLREETIKPLFSNMLSYLSKIEKLFGAVREDAEKQVIIKKTHSIILIIRQAEGFLKKLEREPMTEKDVSGAFCILNKQLEDIICYWPEVVVEKPNPIQCVYGAEVSEKQPLKSRKNTLLEQNVIK